MRKLLTGLAALLLTVMVTSVIAFAYFSYRSVNVIATHRSPHSWHILVDHLPLTSKQKINWWLKNEDELMKANGFSAKAYLQDYNIAIWAFGEGYKALEKYDRLCFDDMPPPKNCIEKDRLMYITLTRDGEVSYWLNNTRYIQKANGELIEVGFN
ncbi:DUF943 family protein [Pantoea sp. FN0302]|uniref:DUF943 family protein n=1 Tax=Pantoea sp. FN0302 TaxID=3418558 RepID=UPI003CF4F9AF